MLLTFVFRADLFSTVQMFWLKTPAVTRSMYALFRAVMSSYPFPSFKFSFGTGMYSKTF